MNENSILISLVSGDYKQYLFNMFLTSHPVYVYVNILINYNSRNITALHKK